MGAVLAGSQISRITNEEGIQRILKLTKPTEQHMETKPQQLPVNIVDKAPLNTSVIVTLLVLMKLALTKSSLLVILCL